MLESYNTLKEALPLIGQNEVLELLKEFYEKEQLDPSKSIRLLGEYQRWFRAVSALNETRTRLLEACLEEIE